MNTIKRFTAAIHQPHASGRNIRISMTTPLISSLNTIKLLTAAIVGTIALQGCSGLQSSSDSPVAVIEPSVEKAAIPARPFPAETLYALLVAEVAGNRDRFDIALGNYVQQAHKTRDPNVAARATYIAQYLKAHQVTLDTAQLWLELQPENNEARLIVATELSQSGRLLEAFEQSKVLLANGSTTLFQSIGARAARATDIQREQLLQAYNALLTEHPKHQQLLVGRGLLLQQQQQFEAALMDARSALKNDKDYIPAAILEASLLNELDRTDEALKFLSNTIERNPENKRLRLQYARLLSSYDLDLAYEQFTILLEQSPRDADMRLSLALICTERGNTAEAKSHFDILLRQNQRSSTANYYLGRIAETEQNEDLALQHYLAVEPGNDYLPALLQSSTIFIRRGDFKSNTAQFQQSRRLYPNQHERFFLLEAELLKQQQQFERAETVLDEGLAALPLNSKILYTRAMLLESQQELERAEQDLRTIIKYEPDNAGALNALGYTLADNTDRLEEALELIQKALNIKPDDPAIIDSMGWVQYRLGNFEEAVLRLSQAFSAFPDPEIAAHLGEALWAMGDKTQATSIWEQGMALDAENSIIPETVERLTGAPLSTSPTPSANTAAE